MTRAFAASGCDLDAMKTEIPYHTIQLPICAGMCMVGEVRRCYGAVRDVAELLYHSLCDNSMDPKLDQTILLSISYTMDLAERE